MRFVYQFIYNSISIYPFIFASSIQSFIYPFTQLHIHVCVIHSSKHLPSIHSLIYTSINIIVDVSIHQFIYSSIHLPLHTCIWIYLSPNNYIYLSHLCRHSRLMITRKPYHIIHTVLIYILKQLLSIIEL